jgi:hypothetical protein
MMVASCRNKYYGTNFISAVPTSLLIAPGLRTIHFLLYIIFTNLTNLLRTLGRMPRGAAAGAGRPCVCGRVALRWEEPVPEAAE